MNEKKDIITKNSNGEYHGYQEYYIVLNNLRVRCMAKNGLPVGYTEWHGYGKATRFHIR